MTYRLLRLGGHPVVALPSKSKSSRHSLVRCINGFTPKRFALKQALRALVSSDLDSVLLESATDPLPRDIGLSIDEVLRNIQEAVSEHIDSLGLIWPLPAHVRRGRVYVHSFDRSGRHIGFSKLAVDKSQNTGLANEAAMLAASESRSESLVAVPALLKATTVQGFGLMTTAPIPSSVRPVRSRADLSAQIYRQLAGTHHILKIEDVEQLGWWKSLLSSTTEVRAMSQYLRTEITAHGLTVSTVHGDFAPKNILQERSSGRVWVVDWENATSKGPWLTDQISYLVACAPTENNTLVGYVHERLRLHNPIDIIAAVAYLHFVGFERSASLARYWHSFLRNN